MARRKADLPDAARLGALVDGNGRLAVRVTPGAREETLAIEAGQLVARVRAKPQDGAANDAVRDLLARAFRCAPSRVGLLRGATSREKLFQIDC